MFIDGGTADINFNAVRVTNRNNVAIQIQDIAGDVCEYPLARNLVLLAVVIASESIVRFVLNSERENRSATLGDFSIQNLEMPTPGE